MTRPEKDNPTQKDAATAEERRVAPLDENFEHQLKRFVAEREARRAATPGLYR
jgi:hypothetical protein